MHQSPAASSRSYRMVGHKGSPPRHCHVPGVLAVQDGDVPQGWHGMASRAVPVLNGKEQVCCVLLSGGSRRLKPQPNVSGEGADLVRLSLQLSK